MENIVARFKYFLTRTERKLSQSQNVYANKKKKDEL